MKTVCGGRVGLDTAGPEKKRIEIFKESIDKCKYREYTSRIVHNIYCNIKYSRYVHSYFAQFQKREKRHSGYPF